MCRRFGFLHTRVLLYRYCPIGNWLSPSHSLTNMQPTRQDELRELQDQLVRLDAEDSEENPLFLQSRKLDDAQEGSIRRALIQEIDDKLKEYGKI